MKKKLTIVSYDLIRSKQGISVKEMIDTDQKISRAIGFKPCGSGVGFGMRDLEFAIDMPVDEVQRRLKADQIVARVGVTQW